MEILKKRSQIGDSTYKIIFYFWASFCLFFMGGFSTQDVFRGLFGITVLYFLFFKEHYGQFIEHLRTCVGFWTVLIFIAISSVCIPLAICLDYEAIHGTLFDFTQYAQALYNFANGQEPLFTITGEAMNYHGIHRSLSLYPLKYLYQMFQSPYVLLLWQAFFHTLLPFVALAWYQAVHKKHQKPMETLGLWMAFLTFVATPTFLLQILWPYTFHVMATFFLALGYLCYFQKKWLLTSLCLVAMCYEKEEFSFIAITFSLLIIWENMVNKPPSKEFVFKNILFLIVSALAFYAYVSSDHSQINSFEKYFGHLGTSPSQIVRGFFQNPWPVLHSFFKLSSLKYLFYFAAVSFVWWYRQWSAVKYFIPVLPLLIFYCLAKDGYMQLLKDHYALPLMVGVGAVHIFGIYNSALADCGNKGFLRNQALPIFCVITLCPLLWPHKSQFKTLKDAWILWQNHKPLRQTIRDVKQIVKDDDPICCEERLCSVFAQRATLVEANVCFHKPPVLTGTDPVVFIVYKGFDFKNQFQNDAKHEL